SGIALNPGATYFFTLVDLVGQTGVTRAGAMIRVAPGTPRLTGGDLSPRYVNTGWVPLLEMIRSAVGQNGTGGIGLIGSPNVNREGPGSGIERALRAALGSASEVPHAIHEAIANWIDHPLASLEGELTSRAIAAAMDLAGSVGAIFQAIQQGAEIGEYL